MQETELQRDKAAQNGGKPFVPVTHRTGFLGLFGKEEPSRAYYLQRIHECEEDIDFERQFVFKHGYARSYFVVFETQVRLSLSLVLNFSPDRMAADLHQKLLLCFFGCTHLGKKGRYWQAFRRCQK